MHQHYRTDPNYAAVVEAFRNLIAVEGIDEAADMLSDLGDEFGLWPPTPPAEDIDERAWQVIGEMLSGIACGQRIALLRAVAAKIGAMTQIAEAA